MGWANQGLLYRWTERTADFLRNDCTEGGKKAPKITPRGWIFRTMIFMILKNSHQDLFNEGSNFIMSPLEVGH